MLVLASTALGQGSTTVPVRQAASKSAAAAASSRAKVTEGILSARLERAAPDRGALEIATKPDVVRDLRLYDPAGKEVAVTRSADGRMRADVDPNKSYVLAPPATERKPLTKEGAHLPARYLTFAPGGATNLGGLFLRPAVVPLTWDEQIKAYATELLVGYEFEDGAERPLAAPKTVAFFAEGANARIRESTVTITSSGSPGYKRVVLSTGEVEGETRFTARASAVDELKSSVTVRREPGAIALSLPSTELPAFGVGSGELTVSLLGRDGLALAAPQSVEVQLSSRRLRQPASVVIEQGKSTARADVRTTGYGSDEIVARSGSLRAVLPVRLVFPVAALVAAIVGGLLGGGARYLRNRRKRGPLLLRRVVEGTLVGLIVVGAVWTGLVSVDVSTGILGTPFGAFVLAALAGYLGCVLLDRIAKRTFGGIKEA